MMSTKSRFVFLLFMTAGLAVACSCRPKSDEERILDALNSYLEEHALGNYEESYKYLAYANRRAISLEKWIVKNMEEINSVKLMRDPRLTNLTVHGNQAEGILNYKGIPPEYLTSIVSQMFLHNLHLPKAEIIRGAEEYMNEHFDEISAPQTMKLAFVKEGKEWKLLLELEKMSKPDGP